MDQVIKEFGIPRKQIRPTGTTNRFIVIAHKSWLQNLHQHNRVVDFPIHKCLDEWPIDDNSLGYAWSKVIFTTYKKYGHQVLPLSRGQHEKEQQTSDLNLTYGQLLQYISYRNFKNVWKHSHNLYSSSINIPVKDSRRKRDMNSTNSVPYDALLRDIISRIYDCKVIQLSVDKYKLNENNGRNDNGKRPDREPQTNLYSTLGVIETMTQFVIVYNGNALHTMLDCVTYSPALLDKSYSKPLFLIYQLLQLLKGLHDMDLVLGNVGLNDIFLTENLWLQVIPHLESNILHYDNSSANNSKQIHGDKLDKLIMTKEVKMEPTLKDFCEMWCNGNLSNFDYLTILNSMSGRRLGVPGRHHIMPWVTDFASRNGQNWRDLAKSKYRLTKGDAQLDLMFGPVTGNSSTIPHHISDVLSEITFYVYMARRTTKNILCKHVRPIWVPAEYPATIQRLQEWSPDECIPEFYSDPLVFKSIHEDLPDLMVPPWSTCPEDFIIKHREALESQFVSERLHHWIDLNFGYKLTGNAAIKAKNVYLSLADNHTQLTEIGIVQLFSHPHPPKQFNNIWMNKTPPRIYSYAENRRRLCRSTEDLSTAATQRDQSTSSSRRSPNINSNYRMSHDENTSSLMERSTSYHTSVYASLDDMILLPKDYNPIMSLQAVENMGQFLLKTFQEISPSNEDVKPHENQKNIQYFEECGNAFTNQFFTEAFESNSTTINTPHGICKSLKQVISDRKTRDLQVIGCLIVEIFLAKFMRPLGSLHTTVNFEDRIRACQSVVKTHKNSLPKCVQYPVELLLNLDNLKGKQPTTEIGLPQPNAYQLLLPLINQHFPFPPEYNSIFTTINTLMKFQECKNLLEINTFVECNGKDCSKYEDIDKERLIFKRKIAECKVRCCVLQIEPLLTPKGYEQFNLVELLLPHVCELIQAEDTSILAAWYLFDTIAMALGPTESRNHLLYPILKLYDTESEDKTTFFHYMFDSSMKFSSGGSLKSKKSFKLYHHSFLMRLMVRFGLNSFLDNFIAPLIEAVGGYKETPNEIRSCHFHDNSSYEMKRTKSGRSFHLRSKSNDSLSNLLVSPDETTDKTLSPSDAKDNLISADEMFEFDNEITKAQLNTGSSTDGDSTSLRSIGDRDSLDLQLNHSQAEEAIEDTTPVALDDENQRIRNFLYAQTKISGLSFEDDLVHQVVESPTKSPTKSELNTSIPTSPTISIPGVTFHTQNISTIDCIVGSKKSIDSNEFLVNNESNGSNSKSDNKNDKGDSSNSSQNPTKTNSSESSSRRDSNISQRISEISAESLIWLSHRLGPVLTARHLSRNLLKMLTLCYVGQENLLPVSNDIPADLKSNLNLFTISEGKIVGDLNANKVLDCLTSISILFGEHFILFQYFPHVTELIALCKRRITVSLEGGLISSLQLIKYIIPCLSDSTIMDQLQDVILRGIVHPIIRLLGSSKFIMPNGFLARSVLARKLLDTLYVLAIRIGPGITREQICQPALQRFFLIFDKAYGIADNFKESDQTSCQLRDSPTLSSDDSHFVEIRREGGTREWTVKGSPLQISHALKNYDNELDSITPPVDGEVITRSSAGSIKERAVDEIKEVFTPNLAHVAYVAFLKYLGEHVMKGCVKNLQLILSLCHEYEQPQYRKNHQSSEYTRQEYERLRNLEDTVDSNSFGTMIVGNRIEVQNKSNQLNKQPIDIGPMEAIDLVAYKLENVNTNRHLRGNWLAYWEHEIGRSDKDNHFNFKQMKLQNYIGHTNSIRAILCLDNENSFMSASKDKTVKLWSLRSEGDGTKISSSQYTYTNHRKSVHSLAFLESLRLTVSCDSGVHLWDPFVGSQIDQLDSPKFSPVSVVKTFASPSTLIVAGTADGTCRIIDGRTFSYVNEWKVGSSPTGTVRCIAMAPSGNWIAVGLSTGWITILDSRTGMILSSWKATDNDLLQMVAFNDNQLISTSLDHSILVWNLKGETPLFHMKNAPEPAHCLLKNENELIFGTPANRIGVHPTISADSTFSVTRLRVESLKGVLTSMTILPLNRMLLVGGDSGNISLLC